MEGIDLLTDRRVVDEIFSTTISRRKLSAKIVEVVVRWDLMQAEGDVAELKEKMRANNVLLHLKEMYDDRKFELHLDIPGKPPRTYAFSI
jgi:hypothetical protein